MRNTRREGMAMLPPLPGVTRSNVSTATYTTTHPCGYAAGDQTLFAAVDSHV